MTPAGSRLALAVLGVAAFASVAEVPSCKAPPLKECDTRVVAPANVVRDAKGKPLVATATHSECDRGDVIAYHVQLALLYRTRPPHVLVLRVPGALGLP